MWNEPPIMLPATGVMSVDGCADMASLGGIDDEFATPVAEMTTPVSVSEITQCDQTLVSLHKAPRGDASHMVASTNPFYNHTTTWA